MEAVHQSIVVTQNAERAILRFFPPSDGSTAMSNEAFSESDFRSMSEILRRMGRDAWSKIPRIYTILRLIDELQLLDSMIAEGLSDIWLPFTIETLPGAIKSQSTRFRFLEVQGRVLTESLDLEKENGQHGYFSKMEDVPFVRIAELGKGGFGFVDRVVSTLSYTEYARKLISRGRTFKKNMEVLRDFENELATLKKLSHKHIVQLKGSYTDPKFVGILMSPIADCNLKEFLQQSSVSQESRSILRTYFGCLAAALCYLHENHIRHKDVKPENVLVKGHTVYLTDFGISLDWTESGHSTTSGYTVLTRRYCAPEVADFVKRNSSSDIWSLGCIFLEIWTVLRGKTVDALIAYLENAASQSTCYHRNFSAIQNWCSTVKDSSGSPADNVPLEWIGKMLQLDQSNRCAARTLCEYIQEANDDPKNKFRFSGDCCIEDDEPESELSVMETAVTLTQTTGPSKALSPNDNAKSSDNVFPVDEQDLGSMNLGLPQTTRKAQMPKPPSRASPRRNTNRARSSSQLTLQQYFSPRHSSLSVPGPSVKFPNQAVEAPTHSSLPVPAPLTPSHHRITGTAETSVPDFSQLTMSPSRSSQPKVGPVQVAMLNATSSTSSHKRKAESIENPVINPSLFSPHSSRNKRNPMFNRTPTANYTHLGLDPLPDVLAPSLLCVFVGVNPSIKTATTRRAYAYPSNLFWKLLHSSGCTTRQCRPEEDQDMPLIFSLGLTNLVQRPTRDAAQLTKDEMDNKVNFLEEKIRRFKPESVCLVGKGIWESIWRVKHGRKIRNEEFRYGWQDESENMCAIKATASNADGGETRPWEGAMVFVATSTSWLAKSTSLDEKEAIWRVLGEWVQRRREERRGMNVEGAGEF